MTGSARWDLNEFLFSVGTMAAFGAGAKYLPRILARSDVLTPTSTKISSNGRTAVIGETTGRVVPYAERHGYEYFEPKGHKLFWMKENREWIHSCMDKGYTIIDIGLDPNKVLRSPFYRMEVDELNARNYYNWIKKYGGT
jgi:hypothetical protein